MSTIEPGAIVAERFRIERLAGTGGMGAVYRAIDLREELPVALKILTGITDHEAERFGREARVLGELRHPGIVRYVASGATERGERWLAMEWLDGPTLQDVLRSGPMPVADAIDLAMRVTEALGYAHRRGIVHRDIKPANLLLASGEIAKIKVLDFGVAAVRGAAVALTRTGVPIGTPGYMAPEQVRGAREVDARADVFALGSVLYRCLTGKRAFPGSDVLAVLSRVLLDEVPPPSHARPDVPARLDALVARMLSKDPSARPSDAAAVHEELRAIAQGVESTRLSIAAPRSSSLGAAERRVLCMLMARAPSSIDLSHVTTVRGYAPPVREQGFEAVARAHGGQLDVLADGSLIVVFAAKGSATDQAVRAARCALAMRPLLGGATVAVVAGRSDDGSAPAAGEAIDRGIALLAEGEPVVRVDDAIVGLLDARFELAGQRVGAILRGERESAGFVRTVLGKPTECVGRTRELATLEALLREAIDEPCARAALVVGPSGIGKSRVAHELLERLSRDGPEVWAARGDPVRAGSPFALVAPLVRHAAGIRDVDAPETRRAKLAARVARTVRREDAQRVTVFLAELIAAPWPDADADLHLRVARTDPAVMSDQTARAFLDFVAAECAERPLVLVLDDVQWADAASVRYVDAALRTLSDRPLFVLGLARPEVHDTFPRLWADRGVQEVRLGELSRKACEALVRQVLPTLPPERVARIAERCGGHAFYLEELLRAGAYDGDEDVPSSVLAMVQARLEALGADTRRVLRAASVFGQVFWNGGVAALVGDDDVSSVDDLLADLVDREVVVPRPDTRFDGQTELAFRHALVRDAAYAMLTDDDRVVGHRLAAEWLTAAGESDARVIAEHFLTGCEPGRAIEWFRCAAEQALDATDLSTAVELAARAVQCGATDEVLGAARLIQAEAHAWAGAPLDAERCALEALANLPAGSDRWARTVAETAVLSGILGRKERLQELAKALVESFQPHSPHVTAAARLAMHLTYAGMPDVAASVFALLDRHAADVMRRDPLTGGHVLRAFAVRANDVARGLPVRRAALDHFRRAGAIRSAITAAIDLGFSFAELGAFDDAVPILRDAANEARRLGLASLEGSACNNLVVPLHRVAQTDEGLRAGERALEIYRDGDRRFGGGTHVYMAQILEESGDLDRAERHAREGVELLAVSPPLRACGLAALARIQLRRGDVAGAVENARDAARWIGKLEEGEAYVRLVHAEVLRASGDEAGAREALASARDWVLARAAAIAEPELRASLQREPWTARILELAAEL